MTPRESIEARCRQAGVDDVVRSCIAVLEGRPLDDDFAYVLAGPASFPVMGQCAGGTSGYWPRVWALRAFLYAWDTIAAHQVISHLDDPAWRVREMAAKVVARQRIGDAFDAVNRRRHDPVPRVRRAAERALIVLVAHEA